MAGKSGQTVGFHYMLTLVSGIGRTALDSLRAIEVGGKEAWNGNVCSEDPQVINAPDLFGGEEKEGGIQGAFRLLQGKPDQILPPAETVQINNTYTATDGLAGVVGALLRRGPLSSVTIPSLKDFFGVPIGEFRGFVTVVYDGLVSSMNPYLKEWRFRVWRARAGWHNDECWYPEKAVIWLDGSGEATARLVTLGADAGGDTIEVTDAGSFLVGQGIVIYGEGEAQTRTVSSVVDNTITFSPSLDRDAPTGSYAASEVRNGTIHAMNPAHIIYQCYTDPDWGKGEDPEALDEDSFIYAANLFCAERLGLCIPWYRQEDVDSFIQFVCDHVGAITYQDRATGKHVIRVLRDDYNIDDLPHFDLDSGLLEIEEDDSASSEVVNEVVITGFDPITRQKIQMREQNIAAWHAHGGPISRSMEFKGLPTRELCGRKAMQELKLLSGTLKRFRLKFDRRAWQLAPGGVCRISSEKNNISNMVIRLGEMTEGTSNGQRAIVAKAMEDVYAMPSTNFTAASEYEWTPPVTDPQPALDERAIELGYRDLYLLLGPADLAQADPTDCALGTLAIPTAGNGSYLYDLASMAEGEESFAVSPNRNYTASATLVDAVGALDTTFTLENLYDFGTDNEGEVFLIDDEQVQLTAYDDATGEGTFVRGGVDSIPAAHAAGARLWSIDDDLVNDGRTYVSGETVAAKVLPRSGTQVLGLNDAAELTVEMSGRQNRPYPPANVQVNGVSIFSLVGEQGEFVLTWNHRDRLTQEDQVLGHTEASVGPEAGTTYTIRIYDVDDNLLRTETGIGGATWTYDAAAQAADGSVSTVRVELESVRDGLASHQTYSFLVILNSGYGYGYGLNYGGA